MRRATVLLVTVLAAACTSTPPEHERLRVERMEDAVTPLAATALEAGQLETARRLYRRLMEVDSKSVEARMGLGHVAMHQGDPSTAVQWYATAFAVARVPRERHAARLAQARAALADGQFEKAKESFESLLDSKSNITRKTAAWAYNGIGLTLLLEGDVHGAVEAMEQAVLRAPNETKIQKNHLRALAMAAVSGDPPPDEYEDEFEEPSMMSEEADPEINVPRADPVDRSSSTQQPFESRPLGANRPASRVGPEQTLEQQAGHRQPQHGKVGPNATETGDSHHRANVAKDSSRSPDSASRASPVRLEGWGSPANRATGDAKISAVLATGAPQPEEYVETTSPGDASAPLPGAKKIELRRGAPAQVAPADAGDKATAPVDAEGPAERAVPDGPGTRTSNDPSAGRELAEQPPDSSQPIEEASLEQSAWESLPEIRALMVDEPLNVWNQGSLYLQAASFRSRGQADALASKLRGLTDRPVHISESPSMDGRMRYRVRIGPIQADETLHSVFNLHD